MYRCFSISILVHCALVGLLIVLSVFGPSRIEKRPMMRVSLLQPMPQAVAEPTPQPPMPEPPQAEPTPAPTPIPTPKPVKSPKIIAPNPKKTPEPKKIKKPERKTTHKTKEKLDDKKIIENIPTPKPTPAPTPKQTPKPVRTAKPVPTPPPVKKTPTPKPPKVRSTPVPRPPAPRVQQKQVAVEGVHVEKLGYNYFALVLSRIEQNFSPPFFPKGITCQVSITIERNGTISNIRLIRSSGNSSLDRSAIAALEKTRKLPPLYDSFRETSITVKLTFDFEKRS